jgi:hypothetical protein
MGVGARYRIDTFANTQTTQTNLLLGSLWTVTPNLGLAMTVDNLLNPDNSIPTDYRLVPGMSLGANYNYHRLIRLKMDVSTASNDSWSAPTVAGGIESHLNRWSILRIGGSHNYETGFDSYAAGLGFTGPKFSLNVGYTHLVNAASSARTYQGERHGFKNKKNRASTQSQERCPRPQTQEQACKPWLDQISERAV